MDSLKEKALQRKKTQKVSLKNTPPTKIEEDDIWVKILEQGNPVYQELPRPNIDDKSFIFTVSNELEKDVVSKYFNDLNTIYYQICGKTALWKTIISETSKQKVDPSKKAKFDEFAKTSEIVNKINDLFNLDLT